MCSIDIFLGLLAVLFPPLPVWVKRGICSVDSVINILLLVLGYLPGLLHAWYIIAKYPEPPFDYDYIPQDAEHGRIYVFVHNGGHGASYQGQQPSAPQQQQGAPNKPYPHPQGQMNYGATSSNANPAGASSASQQEEGTTAGPSDAPPPSYAQVVAGDHKIQTQD
ncbi:hypothetical protein VTK56DRAFT_8429 [Thermocarpiscus australiensis]